MRLGKYPEAIECFRMSINISSSSISHVFLGKALAKNGDIEGAKDAFSRVNCSDLDDSEDHDFAVGMTVLATASKEVCDIEAALSHWNLQECSSPKSRSERDSSVIALLQLENELLRQAR